MIFFFTGTGNSEYTAREIAKKIGVSVVSIGESVKSGEHTFHLADGESLGFVFPIYAWSVPEIVQRFISVLELENYSDQYVFAVFTCGASIGTAYDDLKKCLAGRGIELKYARDLLMPENYILMFRTESEEKQEKIFEAAESVIDEIAEAVATKTEAVVLSGRSPIRVISRAVNYLFSKYALGTKKFRVTDGCISCGFCEKCCPVSAITMTDGKPQWCQDKCAKCMACINRCPVQAIEYGRATKKRQRYTHPTYRNRGQGTEDK